MVHRLQELLVVLRARDFVEEEFHRVDDIERMQQASEQPDALQFPIGQKEFFFAGGAAIDVEAGEDAFFHQFAIEMDFAVPGSFELFEDDFVHTGAGIDQGGGDDGQRAAFFEVSRGAEEALGFVQGVGIHAAGEDFSAGGDDGIVGAGQARDGVEHDDDVFFVFDESFCFFDDHFRDLDVAGGGFIEGGGDDLTVDGALHIGDFFASFIDEQDDEDGIGVIAMDGVGDILQQHGLTGARR